MADFTNLFWLFFILVTIQPILQRRMLEAARIRLMQKLERVLGVRIITLIHRQETMSFLGFPVMRFIDVNDSEAVIRAIRLTEPSVPIDLVLHTPGGLALASVQIARALKRHPARTRVVVPHYAMSGGTLIALAAQEILMDPNSVLGPVDPQLGEYPAASILRVIEQKSVDEVDDETLIRADIARKAIRQLEDIIYELLADKMPAEQARSTAQLLSRGEWTHDYPITVSDAKRLGLKVSTDMPEIYYQLMNLYPQPVRHTPAVQYLPPHPSRMPPLSTPRHPK
ncbi:MAG: SDH family Clp fold serine proteinase [Kiritimatiellia bacterium]